MTEKELLEEVNVTDSDSDEELDESPGSPELKNASAFAEKTTGKIPSSLKSRLRYHKSRKDLSEQQLQELRMRVNGRERQRMHDLNTAMDGLREVMPYARGPSVRKLGKMATLLLARNYIIMLTKSLRELEQVLRKGSPGGIQPATQHSLPSQHSQQVPPAIRARVLPLAGHYAFQHPHQAQLQHHPSPVMAASAYHVPQAVAPQSMVTSQESSTPRSADIPSVATSVLGSTGTTAKTALWRPAELVEKSSSATNTPSRPQRQSIMLSKDFATNSGRPQAWPTVEHFPMGSGGQCLCLHCRIAVPSTLSAATLYL